MKFMNTLFMTTKNILASLHLKNYLKEHLLFLLLVKLFTQLAGKLVIAALQNI